MIARLAAFLTLIALPVWAEVPVQEVKSPGGITAWLVEAPEIPFVALEIRFRGGAALDAPGKEGAVGLMAGLLEEGTGDLDAQGFAAARDALAASYRFGTGTDSVSVSARFLSENRDQAADLLRRAIVEPSFAAEALERVRAQILSSLRSDAQDPAVLASQAFDRVTFGDHVYARPTDGTLDSIASLTVADIKAAHMAALARDRVYVAAVGDISAANLGPMLDKLLGGLPQTGAPLPGPAKVDLHGQTVVEPFPGPQSVILFGHEGIRETDPDFFPAFVVSEILGGSRFGTRLMTEVREKRGLTYGIGAGLSIMDHAALVAGQVQTANATVKPTIDVIRAEWARIPEITQEELDAAKTYLTGAYPLRWDGNANIARALVGLQMDGYPIDYPAKRNGYIEAVTLADAQRAARKVFDPARLSFVVVGSPVGLDAQ
ncbi:M16 family metallopeptidase [Gemmobacter nectariphilus]|uniref:M16 family metallopeptidase n=1 Tax=Gemmobacter nectariphilus TaxID=220343 RepID=UPI000409A9E6|nr:pitrilysin family protein [Gemmobacter nectariphilus]